MTETVLPTVLVVAVALIDVDGRVLIAKRPEGKQLAGLWEFPGGKVETGETPEETLTDTSSTPASRRMAVSILRPQPAQSMPVTRYRLSIVCAGITGSLSQTEGDATSSSD